MNYPDRTILVLGALLAATAVGLGAFAAHGLDELLIARGYEAELSQRMEWFETAVRYQMYHSLGLIIAGLLGGREISVKLPAVCFVLGILLFSGSLYTMSIVSANYRWLGAIVPLGGVSLIIGWVVLAWKSWPSQSHS